VWSVRGCACCVCVVYVRRSIVRAGQGVEEERHRLRPPTRGKIGLDYPRLPVHLLRLSSRRKLDFHRNLLKIVAIRCTIIEG
jgi:hypothetical protein